MVVILHDVICFSLFYYYPVLVQLGEGKKVTAYISLLLR